MTDRYLLMLWRKACLKEYNNSCVMCGDNYTLACHHFIKRRVRVLRYDWRNGFPLCPKCHASAHQSMGNQKLINIMGEERFIYLAAQEKITLKDYCVSLGMRRAAFLDMMAQDLKSKIIEGYK